MRAGGVVQIPQWRPFAFLCYGFGNRFFDKRQLADRAPGFDLIFLNQIHSDHIVHVNTVPSSPPSADACISSEPGLLLVIQTADCLPVLLVDPVRKVIGAGHCGWKGTAKGLAAQLVQKMMNAFGAEPKDIHASMGPCIGSFRYEVGEMVRRAFRENRKSETGFISRENKLYFDLKQANRDQLLQSGVKKIYSISACTYSDEAYDSFRRDGGSAGRMLSFIGLRK
jgi:hypothetical protein